MPTKLKSAPDRRRAFVKALLTGPIGVRFNATEAALVACSTKSRHSASTLGARMLDDPKVRRMLDAHAKRMELSTDRVLEEWKRLAFADMRDFASWGPDGVALVDSTQLTDDQGPAVQEVREHRRTRRILGKGDHPDAEVEEREVRVKLHDKVQALVNLSRYLGILREHASEPAPIFPRGFFAALVMGDVNQIKGFLEPEAAEQLDTMKRVGPPSPPSPPTSTPPPSPASTPASSPTPPSSPTPTPSPPSTSTPSPAPSSSPTSAPTPAPTPAPSPSSTPTPTSTPPSQS